MSTIMKLRKIVVYGAILACMLSGCSHGSGKGTEADTQVGNVPTSENKEHPYIVNLPSKISEDDEPIICVCDLNLEIIDDLSMNGGFSIHILSAEHLDASQVTVSVDTIRGYQLLEGESTLVNEKFSQNVCLLYNDIDWANLRKLELSGSQKDIEEFQMLSAAIEEEYNSLTEEDFPVFYDNQFYLQFNSDEKVSQDEFFDKITVNIKGKDYLVNVGSVRYRNTLRGNPHTDKLHFSSPALGKMWYRIAPNKDGIIDLMEYQMEAEGDVIIKDIRLLYADDKISLDEINLASEIDGMFVNQQWESGQEYAVDAGETVIFSVKVKDENFCNNQNYAVNIYFEVEYEYDGNIYLVDTQALCETRHDSQTLYAMFKDGIDTTAYYNEYVAH